MSVTLETSIGSYRWHENWLKLPDALSGQENRRTHAVAITKDGRIFIFHQATPSMLVYNSKGELIDRWGNYPGAHGMTLVEENGQELLWLVDETKESVDKTTLTGEVIQQLPRPDHPSYREGQYSPTEVAVNELRHGGNGDIWIADGYGSFLVHRYNSDGRYLLTIDGSQGGGRFKRPHGIGFDLRRNLRELYVADRSHQRIQVFDENGQFQRLFGSAFLSRPNGFVFWKNRLIIPDLRGRITVLDGQDRLVEHLGMNEGISEKPGWPDETLIQPGKFNSPHEVVIDSHGNMIVVEWRVGGRVIKLELDS